MERLMLSAKENYEIKASDIIVVDTLIMRDSSRIILNSSKADNFIHAKVAKIGKGCQIIGKGANGVDGQPGLNGYTAEGPCKNGIPGTNGKPGSSAKNGVNLSLYFNKLTIASRLVIDLSGGNGGDGGKGGIGGGGSPGTRLCQGGDGGKGGDGARGGNGGNGGNLLISCKECPNLRTWLGELLYVRTYGGNAGLGGDGGYGGLAGLVSSGNTSEDGQQGEKGKMGESGESGKNGAITFEQD